MTEYHAERDSYDWHSPAHRLARYEEQLSDRRDALVGRFAMLLLMLFYTILVVLSFDCSWGSFLVCLGSIPIILLSGDIYERVRDAIEKRVFCARYDKASQARPTFEVNPCRGDVIYLRSVIYTIVMPILPTAFLFPMRVHGMFHQPQILPTLMGSCRDACFQCDSLLGSWLLALGLSLIYGSYRSRPYNYPLTLRRMLSPFKRIPGPDVH
jgi:hypothetical protein